MDTKPIDHPSHNPDVQEALSRRYAPEALTILPLRSGNIAIYAGMPRDLIAIIAPQAGTDEIFALSPKPKPRPTVDLAELGLL